jgi:hypothetical protein
MLFCTRHRSGLFTALGLVASVVACAGQMPTPEQLQQVVSELQERNQILQRNLVEANRSEKETTEQLNRVRERLEALGKNLLDGGDDRLVQAAADLQIAHERLSEVERSATQLSSLVTEYIRTAVVSDPDLRLRVETSLRELDAVLGLRQKPRPEVRTGSLQQARIISIDAETGMLVMNVGDSQGARIGMTYLLSRGSSPYGKAIVADVRNDVCGLFVDSIDKHTESPRMGDIAFLETQASR